MTVFHLNVDIGETEASTLLADNINSECVSVETKLQIVRTDELVAIFAGLAGFASIKQFFVKKIVALPARALAQVIAQQEQLEFLYLQNISLLGEQEDFQALTVALRNHKGLRKVRFYMIRPSLRTTASLNPVISAIAATPNLEEVTLIHCKLSDEDDDNAEAWDGSSLLDLCHSTSLKILTLTFSTELKDEHIEKMAGALESNKALKNVSIRANNLGPTAGIAMGRLLNLNPNLEQLRVQLSSDEHAVPIVEALHRNTNLQRLGLVLPRRVNNKCMREQVLGKITDMLRESNYNLLQMDLVGLSTNVEEIRFYLKVNLAGRKSLLAEGATRDEWARTICANKDDFSVMFYFLRRNPTLCLAVLRRMMSLDSSPELLVPAEGRKRSHIESKAPEVMSCSGKKCKS